jgi:hypothetical protein
LSLSIAQPPIAPLLALTEPLMDALVAVRIPEVLRVNAADDGLIFPPQIPWNVGETESG